MTTFSRWLIIAFALPVASGLLTTARAQVQAPVQSAGDVFPSDNPFTTGVFEGIIHWRPDLGSIFDPPGSIPFQYEYANGYTAPYYPDANPPFSPNPGPANIVVGENSYGIVLINDAEQVRYEHLVLGGSADDVNPSVELDPDLDAGTGVFRVEGFGSLFNNDPAILPSGDLGALVESEGWDERSPSSGFDVYVGLTGSGTLEVFDGGRMEVQDALVIGFAEGSAGTATVDGFSSHIDVRGSDTGDVIGIPDGQIHHLAVGPIGTGVLTVRNGGKIDARTGASIGALETDGSSSIDSGISIDDDTRQPSGTVTVEGLNSRLRIVGEFAIGAFESDIVEYRENLGAGTLAITDDGLVTVDNEETNGGATDDDPGNVRIGRFGRVLLEDGALLAGGDLTSHGVIEGDGLVSAATVFNRRMLGGGHIIVGEDESMILRSTGSETAMDDRGAEFYGANSGTIEVINGIFEYDRLLDETDGNTRFENLFFAEIPPVDPGDLPIPEEDGTIVVQNGTIRFRSGLSNFGVIGFTAGDNLLSADTINEAGGRMAFTGDSDTTIDDDLQNDGDMLIGQDSTLTVVGDLTLSTTASLSLTLSNQELVSNLPQGYIATAGDIMLGGLLDVDAPLGGIFDPMPGDSYLLMSTTGTITGVFDILDFTDILPLSNPGWSWMLDNTGSDLLLTVSDIMPIGADFNGDGIVDDADIAIWDMYFGIDMGASGTMGDADGDGDVDMQDFMIIQMQLGGPGMGALVGSDPLGPGTVPEPTGILLLLGGVVCCAAMRVRRG